MPRYRHDHIHLNSRDPERAAVYYRDVFDGRIVTSVQLDGQTRYDVHLDGLKLYIAHVPQAQTPVHQGRILGLDHFAFEVDDIDAAVAELKQRGADVIEGPRISNIREGLKIAFIQAPENVRIELLEWAKPAASPRSESCRSRS